MLLFSLQKSPNSHLSIHKGLRLPTLFLMQLSSVSCLRLSLLKLLPETEDAQVELSIACRATEIWRGRVETRGFSSSLVE